ncbi:hypothetical protein [Bifidobacterium sp. ESL0790]|uniref:hypothetical protein n=1 Tax=Bifidobacterium sp. ESL0790 TaxID=2983233 RepID=UPI0023F85FB3|nr:hypothetical protein [Bifidobacterium sp. ESL0790]WEV72967.1 hypothetical protein OZY47_03165 [Bifidobacterium sp. ESL0790]
MQKNNAWPQQDPNIPPMPSGASDLPIPDAVPLPSSNNGGTPGNRKKTTTIIIAAIAAVALVAVCGGVGFHLYTQNSHSYAISQYQKASHRLDGARNDLDASISKAKSVAGNIDESQVEDARLIDDYTSTLAKTKKLTNAKPSVNVKDTSAASASELRNATQSANDLATDCENSAANLTKAAQNVVDSKTAADEALQPTEDAVSAAEEQKKSNDREAARNGVDVSDISESRYSSLDGTWTNPNGAWIRISHGILTPEYAVQGSTPPYRLSQCYGGLDEGCLEEGELPSNQIQLVQTGAVERHDETPDIQFSIVVVPRNVSLYNVSYSSHELSGDPTDSSRDRIIVSGGPVIDQGQAPLCTDYTTGDPNPTSCAYYRDGGTVSDASQQRLNDKVDKANKSIATLDKKWQQKAKANFQCRISVVTGAQSSCPATSDDN